MVQKIVSIELPEDSTYRFTKIKAVKTAEWIQEGHVVVGMLDTNPIVIDKTCTVGSNTNWRDMVRTSLVKDIEIVPNSRKIILRTENSIYELEEIDDTE